MIYRQILPETHFFKKMENNSPGWTFADRPSGVSLLAA
jgi:hypothetical protein